MKGNIRILCAGIGLAVLLCGCGKESDTPEKPTNISEAAEKNGSDGMGSLTYEDVQGFGYELLKQNMEKQNPVLSPASAYIALSMVGNGADGETLDEFQKVLSEDMLTTPKVMMDKLPRKDKEITLTLANSAWVDKTVTIQDEWKDKMEDSFRAEVYKEKLSTNQTMNKMNKWVNKNTQGLIQKMLEKPLPTSNKLVLFNALYFKADWQSKFGVEDTYKGDFFLEDGTSRSVDMMTMFGEEQLYIKNDIAEGVILPYVDENLVFMALRPIEENGDMTVREMYETLTPEELSGFLVQEDTTLCNLKLPKFRVEFDEELNESLIRMGLSLAFDPENADLSGLEEGGEKGSLYIGLVRQKALVIVDEEGTEAAAVTEVAACDSAFLQETEPVDVYFDRPFFYMIADKETKVPLFAGIMDCP